MNGRSSKIARGRGVLKLKFKKQSMKLNWNSLRGWGVQNKKLSLGEYGYFLELHNEVLLLN